MCVTRGYNLVHCHRNPSDSVYHSPLHANGNPWTGGVGNFSVADRLQPADQKLGIVGDILRNEFVKNLRDPNLFDSHAGMFGFGLGGGMGFVPGFGGGVPGAIS